MTTLTFTRGDTRTVRISSLTDEDGNAAVFGTDDIVRFTAKRHAWNTDAQALITKSSDTGDITVSVGEDHAEFLILPADLPDPLPANILFVWDVQLAIGGDASNVRTLDSGAGLIVADVTLTAP